MFKQIKKARELMDDTQYKHDEFNWVQIILAIIFSIAIVGIWYYSKEAEKKIEFNRPSTNPIINDLKAFNHVEGAIDDYGGFHPLDKEENELTY